jgi:hypothetical protein
VRYADIGITVHYPDTVVMPISCGPVLAGGGARVRDVGIIERAAA